MHGMKIKLALTIVLLQLVALKSTAQTEDSRFINKKSIGGFVATGYGYYHLEVDLSYQPTLIGGYLHLPLYQTKGIFSLGFDVLPQFGLVQFDNQLEYEFGLNIALVFGFAISENNILSFNMSTGPHYISADIETQAKGFIFSDNLYLQFRHNFQHVEVGFSVGFRHISNAELKQPNRGVENSIVGITIAKPF